MQSLRVSSIIIETDADVARGLALLLEQDPALAAIVARIETPLPLRRRPAGFAPLLDIIVQQQISLTAAGAIWQRLENHIAEITPETVLQIDTQGWIDIGMSRAKQRCIRAVAEACLTSQLSLDTLAELDDEAALAELLQLPGIGPWTGEVYLLSCLGRSDIWPAGDVALQTAVQHALELEQRPKRIEMIALADAWRPVRAIAARLFWQYYRVVAK